jgi:hypothetical protein
MDDAKEHPPPGANRRRASKERPKNRTPSLPQPHDRRQHGASRPFDTALERDYRSSEYGVDSTFTIVCRSISRREMIGQPDLDFNNADDGEFELIPEGIYRLRARVKSGSEGSALKTAKSGMQQYLELELTIESPVKFKGRKLWDRINCHYIGPEANNLPGDQDEIERFRTSVRIGRSKLKRILESAHNIDPHDNNPEAQAKRHIANLLDFDLLSFVGKVVIEKGANGYRDKNVLQYPITNNMVEWPKVAPQRQPIPLKLPRQIA